MKTKQIKKNYLLSIDKSSPNLQQFVQKPNIFLVQLHSDQKQQNSHNELRAIKPYVVKK